jgi:hypothetical protein
VCRRLSGRRTSVRPQGRRRRGPTSLLISSLPPRDSPGWSSSSMVPAIVLGRPHPDPPLGWPNPRPGVRICPLGPRRAGERRWRRRRGLARSFGWLRCGSLVAALAAGRIPRPGRAASAWLRAGAQDLPVGLQEEDDRIPGARSPTNPSSRDQIHCLHGRIRFSLTGSSCLKSGSTTPKSGSS